MNLRVRLSLKLKVFVSVGLFYLAAVGTLTYLTIRSQRGLLLEQMAERAKTGISLMELSVAGPLYRLDVFQLETIAREAKALPNVDYAYIYDNKGRIVGDFHDDRRQLFLIPTDELSRGILRSGETLVNTDYKKGSLDISKPVILGHEKLGQIRLGFDLNPMFNEMRQVTVKALLISAGIFLLGLLVIFGIASKMTSPIEQLTLAAKHIEQGDLQYRVSVKRSDEIGDLAAAFDQMVERLMHRERELKQSQNIIRRADRLSSLGMLTAGLAHEIRNPLVAIRTFTQLLPERYQEAEFRNSFQALALKEVDRICGLINDLLSFARPSTPNVSAEDANEIVESIVRILETEAKEKEIQMYPRLAADLPKIFIDKEQIKQVSMNVILNALQSIEGRGVVEVSTRLFSKNGTEQYVQIEVHDSGAGIPEKDIEDIFNPFFTTKKDGSGLGLSISNQIVQEHGGYIVVESQVGKGTTFLINLPVRQPGQRAAKGRPQVDEEDSGR
ncbi:MAG: HAMP domain-containing protein [Deltaproteobacteria bacterium]|nr:HAMP domain-containing protein [Deltaproteobacteria bacterium]